MANSRVKSCQARLQEIRKELGIKKKDYGKSPQPDIYNQLPEIHIKKNKKQAKKEKKQRKYQRYQLANWYLNKYLKPEYANSIFEAFDDFEDMVEYACTMAYDHIQNCTYEKSDRKTWDEWVVEKKERLVEEEYRNVDYPLGCDRTQTIGRPVVYLNESDEIPEYYWDEFERYCKKHPIKKHRDLKERRTKFIKKINKSYMKTYGKYASGDGDPTLDLTKYMSLCVDKDKMIRNLKRVAKENEARAKQIKNEMDKWFSHKVVSSDFRKKISDHADRVMRDQKKRIKQFIEDWDIDPEHAPRPTVWFTE